MGEERLQSLLKGSRQSCSQREKGKLREDQFDASNGLDRSSSSDISRYMRQDTRLSDVLHVLLHMAEKSDPMTSEVLAKRIGTNPAVIRRMLAGLRDQGYVRSEKGHGGGWMLACELSQVTIRDIYNALGRPSLFAIDNRTELPGCVLEHVVNAVLDEIFEDVRVLLLSDSEKLR